MLDVLSNDTSLNSLRWIYRSAKIVWTKLSEQKQIWVYSSSPPPPPTLKRGRNNWDVVFKTDEQKPWQKQLIWHICVKSCELYVIIIISSVITCLATRQSVTENTKKNAKQF